LSSLFLTIKMTSPIRLTYQERNSLECHFNWNIIDPTKPNWFFEDRIQKIETDLKQDTRNIPQLYAIKGFLQTLYYEKRRDQAYNDPELDQLKSGAETSFTRALNNTEQTNKGYRAVVLANLVFFHTKHEEHQKAKAYLKDYKSLFIESPADHPEVLAMKAYGLSHLLKRNEAVSVYQQALESQANEPKPAEWYFGLALAIENKKISFNANDLSNIQSLLEKALQIDPNYYYATLKLARISWKRSSETARPFVESQIKNVIESVPKKQENVAILEEAASVLLLILNIENAKNIYNECLELAPDSQKALRGIGDL